MIAPPTAFAVIPPPTPVPGSWRIDGPLVVDTVADWHRRLLERLADAPDLALDLSAVTAIDVFGLQLLVAAQRGATEGGRTLKFTAVPTCFDDACASAGIARSLLFPSLP